MDFEDLSHCVSGRTEERQDRRLRGHHQDSLAQSHRRQPTFLTDQVQPTHRARSAVYA